MNSIGCYYNIYIRIFIFRCSYRCSIISTIFDYMNTLLRATLPICNNLLDQQYNWDEISVFDSQIFNLEDNIPLHGRKDPPHVSQSSPQKKMRQKNDHAAGEMSEFLASLGDLGEWWSSALSTIRFGIGVKHGTRTIPLDRWMHCDWIDKLLTSSATPTFNAI